MKLHRRNDRERGSVALVAVIGLLALALALALVTLTANSANVKHTGQAQEEAQVHFIAMAALNRAFAEVDATTDLSGDGYIGGLAETSYTDLSGNTIAQYCAYVDNLAEATDEAGNALAPQYVIRVVVGVPTLASPRYGRVAEARVNAIPSVLFKPKVGAVSIAGPMASNPGIDSWTSSGFKINGDQDGDGKLDVPAIVFTDKDALSDFLKDDMVKDGAYEKNGLDGKITGSPMTSIDGNGDGDYDDDEDFKAPIIVQEDAAFTAEMLNDYRDALRDYAHGLVEATEANGSVTVDYAGAKAKGVVVLHEEKSYLVDANSGSAAFEPRLAAGTHTFTEQTVLIDTSKFYKGGDNMVENHADDTAGGKATTITGSGTLVILHPVGSKGDNNDGRMFNLDWDGDVFVIGYDKDRAWDKGKGGIGENGPTDNLLYLSRARWEVDGNLVLVTKGGMEPSLEARSPDGKPASGLTVNGSLIMLGEATTHEVDLEMEKNANLEVNGLLSVFGKRLELENSDGKTTTFTVNGTVAMGFPDSVDANGDGDFDDTKNNPPDFDAEKQNSFSWVTNGKAAFNFHEDNLNSAIEGLSQLQSKLDLGSSSVVNLDFESKATLARSDVAVAAARDAWKAAVEAKTAGIDVDLIKATLKK